MIATMDRKSNKGAFGSARSVFEKQNNPISTPQHSNTTTLPAEPAPARHSTVRPTRPTKTKSFVHTKRVAASPTKARPEAAPPSAAVASTDWRSRLKKTQSAAGAISLGVTTQSTATNKSSSTASTVSSSSSPSRSFSPFRRSSNHQRNQKGAVVNNSKATQNHEQPRVRSPVNVSTRKSFEPSSTTSTSSASASRSSVPMSRVASFRKSLEKSPQRNVQKLAFHKSSSSHYPSSPPKSPKSPTRSPTRTSVRRHSSPRKSPRTLELDATQKRKLMEEARLKADLQKLELEIEQAKEAKKQHKQTERKPSLNAQTRDRFGSGESQIKEELQRKRVEQLRKEDEQKKQKEEQQMREEQHRREKQQKRDLEAKQKRDLEVKQQRQHQQQLAEARDRERQAAEAAEAEKELERTHHEQERETNSYFEQEEDGVESESFEHDVENHLQTEHGKKKVDTKEDKAATTIQSLFRRAKQRISYAFLLECNEKEKELRQKLKEIELQKQEELKALDAKVVAYKKEALARAKKRKQKFTDRMKQFESNKKEVDKVKKENAQFRARNELLKKNCRNLRINNLRLEKSNESQTEYTQQIQSHLQRCEKDNKRLDEVEASYKGKLEELQEGFDTRTAYAVSEHRIKNKYRMTAAAIYERIEESDLSDKFMTEIMNMMNALEPYEENANQPMPFKAPDSLNESRLLMIDDEESESSFWNSPDKKAKKPLSLASNMGSTSPAGEVKNIDLLSSSDSDDSNNSDSDGSSSSDERAATKTGDKKPDDPKQKDDDREDTIVHGDEDILGQEDSASESYDTDGFDSAYRDKIQKAKEMAAQHAGSSETKKKNKKGSIEVVSKSKTKSKKESLSPKRRAKRKLHPTTDKKHDLSSSSSDSSDSDAPTKTARHVKSPKPTSSPKKGTHSPTKTAHHSKPHKSPASLKKRTHSSRKARTVKVDGDSSSDGDNSSSSSSDSDDGTVASKRATPHQLLNHANSSASGSETFGEPPSSAISVASSDSESIDNESIDSEKAFNRNPIRPTRQGKQRYSMLDAARKLSDPVAEAVAAPQNRGNHSANFHDSGWSSGESDSESTYEEEDED